MFIAPGNPLCSPGHTVILTNKAWYIAMDTVFVQGWTPISGRTAVVLPYLEGKDGQVTIELQIIHNISDSSSLP